MRHLVLCRIERRPPRLDLDNWPHLPLAKVRTTQAADYMALLLPPAVTQLGTRRRRHERQPAAKPTGHNYNQKK